MRREPTEPEIRLWQRLSRKQLGGLKFRRQGELEPFSGDFYCPAIGLVVEVDGHTHDPEGDLRRDAYLATWGLHTFRVTNVDVMTNIEGVLEALLAFAKTLPARTQWRLPRAGNPPPQPLP